MQMREYELSVGQNKYSQNTGYNTNIHYQMNFHRDQQCYELRSLGLDNRTTLVLSNTRELDRELFYKLVYFI